MKSVVVYLHGKGGSPAEAEHYRPLFPGAEMIGFDYHAGTPWEAEKEFTPYFAALRERARPLILIANSVGAYFALSAGVGAFFDRAYLISPVVDMDRLIRDALGALGATEEDLKAKGVIPAPFGEDLSWEYLAYVRTHPIRWEAPTSILFGARDALVPEETVRAFAEAHGASLTVMEDGEHWFHTKEQLAYLDRWLSRCEETVR
ncbi:MAG: alpha/beta hydrolase [Clostridia bacterium]|nr:alpha/beta hydrolase [Clostridia bacterium]